MQGTKGTDRTSLTKGKLHTLSGVANMKKKPQSILATGTAKAGVTLRGLTRPLDNENCSLKKAEEGWGR